MKTAAHKFGRFLLALGLITFLSVALFGASQAMMGMEQGSDGSVSGCLFMGMEEICKMTFIEHLREWQSLFNTTLTQKASLAILLLLFTLAFGVVAISKRQLLLLFNYDSPRSQLYIRHNPEHSLFQPLREAFSQGILNPKIY